MVKQLIDLSKEDDEKLNRISKRFKLSKTDAIKKLIKDYKEDEFSDMFDLNLDSGEKIW